MGDKSENMEFEPEFQHPAWADRTSLPYFWDQTEESGKGSSGGNGRIRIRRRFDRRLDVAKTRGNAYICGGTPMTSLTTNQPARRTAWLV
jgi:hypothetical protein